MAANEAIKVRVKSVTWEAECVNAYDLRTVDGAALPPFTAGAHIDLHLPTGVVRSYSIANAQRERHRYVVGVSRDARSRGGSTWIHERLHAGDVLSISPPRNNFALFEGAPHSVLIGGGIGVTPLLSMVARLEELKRPWTLYYAARSRAAAGFLDRLPAFDDRVNLQFDDETPGVFLDLTGAVRAAPQGSHFYCCGPAGMLSAFENALSAAAIPAEVCHVEYFIPKEAAATEGGFLVELARQGRTIPVPVGQTILQAIRRAGIEVAHSCEQGICGACETRVISGEPEHRDAILSETERARGDTMMICCSGSKSEKLVLDI